MTLQTDDRKQIFQSKRKKYFLEQTIHSDSLRKFLCWTPCSEKSCECCLKDPNKELKGLPTIFLPLPSLPPPLNLSLFLLSHSQILFMVRLLLLWGGTCMRWTLIIETAIERVRNCLHDLIFSSKVQWQNFQTTLTYNKGSSSSSVLLRAAVENWDMRNRHYVRSRRWRFLSQLSNFHFPLTAQHYSAHLTVKSKIDKSFFSAFFCLLRVFFFCWPFALRKANLTLP